MFLSKEKIIGSLVTVYLVISIVSLHNCGRDNSDGTYDYLQKEKNKTAKLLIGQFNAQMFDCDKIDEVLKNVTVLDTTIVGVTKRNGGYFIKAKINTGCKEKYFAELKCDREVVDRFNKSKSNKAFLVARIKKINSLQIVAEVDSLSGKNSLIDIGNSLLLEGDCLAYTEIPTFISVN